MSRHAFWTIIIGESPTAFRAPLREDLQPTLVQLQRKHPEAAIRWFERGQLWETPGHAQDAAKARHGAERPRRGPSWRPGGDHKDPREAYKVPRDVKRKRWAAQAAEGRGPWAKQDSRTTGRQDGRAGGQGTKAGRQDRRTAGQDGRTGEPKDGRREGPRMAERGDRKPQDRARAQDVGKGAGVPSGARRTKAGQLLEKRSAVVGQRKARRDDVPIPGRTPSAREQREPREPRGTRDRRGDGPPAAKGRTFKAGEKPKTPRKKPEDE